MSAFGERWKEASDRDVGIRQCPAVAVERAMEIAGILHAVMAKKFTFPATFAFCPLKSILRNLTGLAHGQLENSVCDWFAPSNLECITWFA